MPCLMMSKAHSKSNETHKIEEICELSGAIRKRLRKMGSYRGARQFIILPSEDSEQGKCRTKRGKRVTIGAIKKEVQRNRIFQRGSEEIKNNLLNYGSKKTVIKRKKRNSCSRAESYVSATFNNIW